MKESLYSNKLGADIIGNADMRSAYGTQLYLTKRGPLEGNRVFPTYAHLDAYINDMLKKDGSIATDPKDPDLCKTAFPGVILSVVNDSNPDLNGLYEIRNADRSVNPGLEAVKIGSSDIDLDWNDLKA